MASFDVTIVAEPQYLRVTTVGNYEFRELFPFLADVKAEADRTGHDHILIDSHALAGDMTEAERFRGGQKIAELFGARTKVAILMPPQQITRLGELAASNRGGRLHVTSSESEALNWLLEWPDDVIQKL